MTTKWKVKDLSRYLELIDDPLYKIKEDGSYLLSEQQAKAILELRLQRLTALGATEIGTELEELAEKIKVCLDILKSREKIRGIIFDDDPCPTCEEPFPVFSQNDDKIGQASKYFLNESLKSLNSILNNCLHLYRGCAFEIFEGLLKR